MTISQRLFLTFSLLAISLVTIVTASVTVVTGFQARFQYVQENTIPSITDIDDLINSSNKLIISLYQHQSSKSINQQAQFEKEIKERIDQLTKDMHDGTLLILRQDVQTKRITPGVINDFHLSSGMGSGGYGNMKRFLLLLKTEGARLSINTFDWTPEHPNFGFSTVIGQHHHVYFQDSPHRSSARWLQQVFNGEDPGDWFSTGWSSVLREIGETPFGDDSKVVGGVVSK